MVDTSSVVTATFSSDKPSRDDVARELNTKLQAVERKARLDLKPGETIEDADIRESYGITDESWENNLGSNSSERYFNDELLAAALRQGKPGALAEMLSKSDF